MLLLDWLSAVRSGLRRKLVRRSVRRKLPHTRSASFETLETRALLAAQVTSITLLNDTGTPGDMITTDPRVSGAVQNNGSGYSSTVEIDLNGDGKSDASTMSDKGGAFTHDPAVAGGIPYGSTTIRARTMEWVDKNTQVFGNWAALSFTLETPPAAQVTDLKLHNDTGTKGDGSTTDPTLAGTVVKNGAGYSTSVEFDHNADGKADGSLTSGKLGEFTYNPSVAGGLPYGSATVRARTAEWIDKGTQVFGNWAALTFTFESPPAAQVVNFRLNNDTAAGSPGFERAGVRGRRFAACGHDSAGGR